MAGLFISFEGPEGAGKTTQITQLAATLEGAGHTVCLTREPGGTKEGEQVRALLLDPAARWSPAAEALLMNAARDAHLREVILPALEDGHIVLCDRFADSTRAYQGGGSDLDTDLIDALETHVCTRMPDLTFVFDLDPAIGLARAAARGAKDRFEAKGPAYHEKVAAAFRALATQVDRCVVIPADRPIAAVQADIAEKIRGAFPSLLTPGP